MKIHVKGVTSNYQLIGQNKPTLVLIHGWGCDWQIWSPLVPLLEKNYQLLLVDLPAFGQSDNPDVAWDTADYAQWLAELLRQLKIEPVTLIGHSFGGKIISIYAANSLQPQPKNLIIIDASGLPDSLPPNKQLQESLVSIIPSFIKNSFPDNLKSKLLAVTDSSHDYAVATTYQKQVLQKILKEDLTDILPKIQISTLIIWGENDTDTPLHQGKKFAKLIPGAQLKTFPTGHYPYLEQPAVVAQTMIKFLEVK